LDETGTIIASTPERVWALVTDITRMGEWSPECRGGRWIGGTTAPAVGARFVGFNAHGPVRWRTHCRVVECAEPHRFAFTVAENGMTWGWRIEPDGDGTRLVQWRERTARPWAVARLLAASGLLGRQRESRMREGMVRTLAAVKATAEGHSPGA
jgi:uncharacterized protein YndB with AHSA1/START domain